MDVKDKIIVVTGAASGIGEGLCRRFVQEKASMVVVADIDEEGAVALAKEINAQAVKCDVSNEADIVNLVRQTEEDFGPIDLFCSNAGIYIEGSMEVRNLDWQRIWEINVMSHVYAARAVIPRMIKRGGGYFVFTASAAGLLTQIGSAPYSVSKHAAIGLAESIAISYGGQGIKVSVLCPMAVRSKITAHGGGIAAIDGMLDPAEVADVLIKALYEERFMVLPHPKVKDYFQNKASDYDRWLTGMRRLAKKYEEGALNLE